MHYVSGRHRNHEYIEKHIHHNWKSPQTKVHISRKVTSNATASSGLMLKHNTHTPTSTHLCLALGSICSAPFPMTPDIDQLHCMLDSLIITQIV